MSRKIKNRKKQDQMHHAQQRFFSRWDVDLTKELHDHFVDEIQKHKARLLYKETNRLSIYLLQYESKNIPAVYDNQREQLVTALPEGAYQ